MEWCCGVSSVYGTHSCGSRLGFDSAIGQTNLTLLRLIRAAGGEPSGDYECIGLFAIVDSSGCERSLDPGRISRY